MLSVIIPHYPIGQSDELLKRCVQTLEYDELVVVVNEGTGFGKAVNLGLTLVRGDFIAIVNNDISIVQGSLRELCDPDRIMSPTWGIPSLGGIGVDFMPSCFVIPRKVYNKVGGFDEQFNLGDYEDNDFYERCVAEKIGFSHTKKVWIYGEQGYTKSKMEIPTQENKDKFLKRWGRLPSILPETYYEADRGQSE